MADSGSICISSNDSRKVSREDIELVRHYLLSTNGFFFFFFFFFPKGSSTNLFLMSGLIIFAKTFLQVQNLIERCLQLYMNRDEVVKTLLSRARIDPGFTTLGRHWQAFP